ncbi:MAG: hypothetical protein AABZ61_13710 [Bacteroidota bacterium]
MSSQQRKLLERWSAVVKPGGRLVYATCTLLRQENEDVVEDFLTKRGDFTLVPPASLLSNLNLSELSRDAYLYLYPHRHGTGGFFAAVMRRG